MTERIDHSNYEAWLLDRLEGNLTTEQERELDGFLRMHPELAPDDGELPTIGALAEQLSPADRDLLKRRLPPEGVPHATNVEDHLIARLEGDLRPVQLEALRRYLIEHPEHQRSERLYALVKTVPEHVAFPSKPELQRHVPPVGMPTRYTLDEFLVAKLEGDLDREQLGALTTYLEQHSEARTAWSLIQATRTQAEVMAYPEKAALKKAARVIPIGAANWAMRLSIAASVAVLLGLGLWYLRSPGTEAPELVQVETKASAPAEKVDVTPTVPMDTKHADSVEDPSGYDGRKKGRSTDQTPARSVKPVVVPVPVPVVREEPLPIAEERPVVPSPEALNTPSLAVVAPPAEAPMARSGTAAPPAAAAATGTTTVRELLAATVRERVLDGTERDARPLNGDDALAMVDRGLKAVGGDHVGLAVARKNDGGVRTINLRLGRNLGISASR